MPGWKQQRQLDAAPLPANEINERKIRKRKMSARKLLPPFSTRPPCTSLSTLSSLCGISPVRMPLVAVRISVCPQPLPPLTPQPLSPPPPRDRTHSLPWGILAPPPMPVAGIFFHTSVVRTNSRIAQLHPEELEVRGRELSRPEKDLEVSSTCRRCMAIVICLSNRQLWQHLVPSGAAIP